MNSLKHLIIVSGGGEQAPDPGKTTFLILFF